MEPPALVFALCIWRGYANVSDVVVASRALHADDDLLKSSFGLAQHVYKRTVGGRPRTRLQHACGGADHACSLARVERLLAAIDAARVDGLAAAIVNTGAGPNSPLFRAAKAGNVPLVALLCARGAIVNFNEFKRAIGRGNFAAANTLLAHDPSVRGKLVPFMTLIAELSGRSTMSSALPPFDDGGPVPEDRELFHQTNFLRLHNPALIQSLEEMGLLESIDGAHHRHIESGDFAAADALVARDEGLLSRALDAFVALVAVRGAVTAAPAPAAEGAALDADEDDDDDAAAQPVDAVARWTAYLRARVPGVVEGMEAAGVM
jgi:hypothetical protein